MGKVFAGSIGDKEIVNIDGTVLGDLENIIYEVMTGKLVDLVVKPNSGLVVKPNSGLDRSKYREDGKFVLIPFSSVVAVKDYIVVDESRAMKK